MATSRPDVIACKKADDVRLYGPRKLCLWCGKPLVTGRLDGKRKYHPECVSAVQRDYSRRYAATHPEKIKAKNKRYYESHLAEAREKGRATKRRWRERHPEEHHQYNAAWRKRHPEYHAEYQRGWRAKNRERVREIKRASEQRRRARRALLRVSDAPPID